MVAGQATTASLLAAVTALYSHKIWPIPGLDPKVDALVKALIAAGLLFLTSKVENKTVKVVLIGVAAGAAIGSLATLLPPAAR